MQMNEGKTCVIEIVCTRELGDPFRRAVTRSPSRCVRLRNTRTTSRQVFSAPRVPLRPGDAFLLILCGDYQHDYFRTCPPHRVLRAGGADERRRG